MKDKWPKQNEFASKFAKKKNLPQEPLQYSVRLSGLSSVYLSDVPWKVEEDFGTTSYDSNIIIIIIIIFASE